METRIPPSESNGLDQTPPCGGSWIRDADGGLTPADQATAAGAGLDWPSADVVDQPKDATSSTAQAAQE